MKCKMSKLNWQGMLAGLNMGKYCLGTTNRISEVAVVDIINILNITTAVPWKCQLEQQKDHFLTP